MRPHRLWCPTVAGLLFLSAALPLGADNVRGLVRAVVEVRQESEFEQTVELHPYELAAVALPSETRFLEGLQLELLLSAEARTHFDSFGLVVYDRLDAVPTVGVSALTGSRAFLHGLLALNRLFYVISLGRATGGASVDLAQGIFRLAEPRISSDFPILVSVIPIMKGVPDSMQSLVFYLKCRPVVRNAGLVKVRILPPPGSHQFAVLVDDTPVEATVAGRSPSSPWEASVELPAGIHSLRVTSPTLQQAESAFSVDPGGTSVVELELRESAASIAIEAPSGAAIYIDGVKIDYPRQSRVGVPAGEHTVRYRVGDFSGARTFTVGEGKRYTVYLELDVSVKED